jgi:hypothetical protein
MMAIRRCQSGGCLVWDAGPLALPQKVAILARLLSATAFMKPWTAPAAELEGWVGAELLLPPHDITRIAAANHRCLITSLSLVGC